MSAKVTAPVAKISDAYARASRRRMLAWDLGWLTKRVSSAANRVDQGHVEAEHADQFEERDDGHRHGYHAEIVGNQITSIGWALLSVAVALLVFFGSARAAAVAIV